MTRSTTARHRVAVIGGGFGGLFATIRALIYNAGVVEHEDWRQPTPVWHPYSVVFADET